MWGKSSVSDGDLYYFDPRKRLQRLLLVVILAVYLLVTYPYSEERWYEVQVRRLAKLEINPEMVAEAKKWRKYEGDGKWHVGLPRDGPVAIGENSAVYVTCHSFHDNGYWNFLAGRPRTDVLGYFHAVPTGLFSILLGLRLLDLHVFSQAGAAVAGEYARD